MHTFLWCLSAGIFSAAWLTALPPVHWIAVMAATALAVILLSRPLRPVGWLLLGFCYGCLWGYGQLASVLPVTADKSDWLVTGSISSLPSTDHRRRRFELRVEQWQAPTGDPLQPGFHPKRLLLSWYGTTPVRAGERWQLQVRLRSLRGFYNPGGFDYHSWLFGRGYSATGYVRASQANQRLAPAHETQLLLQPLRLRQWLLDSIESRGYPDDVTAVLTALIVGDKQSIADRDWALFRTTGTVHLLVVSGLHIGMIALAGFILGAGLGRLLTALGLTLATPLIAAGCAMTAALFYAVISGMGLPVQRALAMIAVFLLATLFKRRASPWLSLGWALLLVALLDPLAVTQSGFWLSFGAVTGLLLWFAPRPFRSYWRGTLEAQWVVAVSLAAALVGFQGQLALASPAINLLAIPWMTFTILPLCLIGAALAPVPLVANSLWQLAAWQIELMLQLLRWLAALTGQLHWLPAMPLVPATLVAILVLALVLLLPIGLWWRWPALILVAALASAGPVRPELEITVLDVGQGLAVVVEAAGRVLVYDTGPAYSESFDAGSAIVAPYLASRGIRHIDRLVVSHGDLDHSGGTEGLLQSIPVESVITSAPSLIASAGASRCLAGDRWRWRDVTFDVLWPDNDAARSSDNDASCVLLIRQGDVAVLLPGDVEKYAENALIARLRAQGVEQVTLLLAPHHGSKSSSGRAFVAATRPQHVVFSAGFNHHFGHPHPVVVARYRRQGSALWHTANTGALTFSWRDGEPATIRRHVDFLRGYWRHPGLVSARNCDKVVDLEKDRTSSCTN